MSTPEPENTETECVGFDPARWLWVLDKAGPQLVTQLSLHGQLLYLEWQQEKRRLQRLMLCSVLSIGFGFLALLFAGFAVLYVNRNTEHFLAFIWALPALFSFVAISLFFITRRVGQKNQAAFSASRQEIMADIALLRGTT